jgi:chemotaxis protein methyltransferase WspC
MMGPDSVEDLLRRRIGLDPDSSGGGLVARAARARMGRLAIPKDDQARYLDLALRSEQEFQSLVDEVVVPESWFFRDVQPFLDFAERFADRWAADASLPPLRVLSAPCARGEEPYSIAMTLWSRGLPSDRFRIDAVDVSRRVLDAARRGVYPSSSLRATSPDLIARFFHQCPGGVELSSEIKPLVHLIQGNLMIPDAPPDGPPYHAIFCRNLLIYLDEPARRRVVSNLTRRLAPDGVLYLGHAEGRGFTGPEFRPVGAPGTFAFARVDDKMTGVSLPGARPTARASRDARQHRSGGKWQKSNPPRRRRLAPPAGEQAVAPVSQADEQGRSDLLCEARRLADEGRHAEALALCERQMARSGPSAAAFHLAGMIHQAAGDRRQAEQTLAKAVYLDPDHEEALLALALLAQRKGEHAAAANFRRRAARAFREKPAS